jgi:hypothetical protein
MPTRELQTADEVRAAVEKEKTAEKPDQGMRHYLIKRSIELGCVECIPDDWGMKVYHG